MADVTLTLRADNSQYINKMKEAQQASQKVYDTVENGSKREKGLIEDIENELTKLQDKRKKAFTIEDIEKYNKKIQEAKLHLQEYEKVGSQVEKTTNTLSQTISRWVLGLGGATAALKVLKDAVLATTTGLNAFNIVGAATKQILYNLVTGASSLTAGLKQVIEVQKQLNDLRLKEIVDTYKAKEQQVLYNKYYFEASDRRKTDAERITLLNKAMDAHNKMLDIQRQNILEQLDANKKLLAQAPGNEKLLQQYGQLNTELLELESERYSGVKRLESMRTSMEQEAIDKRKEQWQRYLDEIDQMNKDADEKEKKRAEQNKKRVDEYYKWVLDKMKDNYKEWEKNYKDFYDWYRDQVDAEIKKNKGIADDYYKWIFDKIKEKGDKEKEEEDKGKANKEVALKESLNLVMDYENLISNIKSQNLQYDENQELASLDKRTQQQLKAAGDNEKKKQEILEKSEAQKAEIERRYKREQQKIDVKQAIINGILAVVKTYAEFGFPFGLIPAGIVAGMVATEVNAIKSQKFAKGGWTGKGEQKDETGERVAGVVHEEEFVVKKGPAHRFREVLEAINREDHNMIVNRFNKLNPETLGVTVSAPSVNNSVSVDNNGSNSRLDQVIKEQRKLNDKISRQRQISVVNGKTIITEGNKTRILA